MPLLQYIKEIKNVTMLCINNTKHMQSQEHLSKEEELKNHGVPRKNVKKKSK